MIKFSTNKARLDKYWKTNEKASSTSEGVYSVNEEMFFDKEVLSINEEAPIMIRIHKNPI
ncbi:hypothetical protein RhiirB3_445339 [Rhizophagus irregularis]|nr:hypothetical protein RhiirB3_445339 [Rhizophagus irregularis]